MISKIEVLNETTSEKFHSDPQKIAHIIQKTLNYLDLESFEVCLKLVESEEIMRLNHLHRNKNKPTDVLSFPQVDWPAPYDPEGDKSFLEELYHEVLGDIIVCPEVAQQNALAIGQNLDRELCFLVVHGILHLCGYDHMTQKEEKIMFTLQNKIVSHLVDHDTSLWSGCLQHLGTP